MKFCKMHLKCCKDTKIGNFRQKVADFYLLLLHYSLFTKFWEPIFGK